MAYGTGKTLTLPKDQGSTERKMTPYSCAVSKSVVSDLQGVVSNKSGENQLDLFLLWQIGCKEGQDHR